MEENKTGIFNPPVLMHFYNAGDIIQRFSFLAFFLFAGFKHA
jgi:hypothetical protein